MTETHFIGKVAQKVVIERDGKFLITRDPNDAIWELPGGRLNVDEMPIDGLAREVQEELGVSIEIKDIFYTEPFMHTKSKEAHIFLIYRGILADGVQFMPDPTEVAETTWITQDEIKNYTFFDNITRALE